MAKKRKPPKDPPKRIEQRTIYRKSKKPINSRLSCGLDKVPFEEIDALSTLEMRELYLKMMDGDKNARNRLAMSVSRFALRRASDSKSKRACLEDLFQEAMLEIVRAMEKYDPSRGGLTTYANWRIFGAIQKVYAATRDIRMSDRAKKYSEEIDAMLVRDGKDIKDTVSRLEAAMEIAPDISVRDQKRIAEAKPRGVYYSTDICNSLAASIKYSYEHKEFDLIEEDENVIKMEAARKKLSGKENKVLNLFLAGKTLRQSSEKLGIPIEAVRKTEELIVQKLAKMLGTEPQLRLRSQREF